MNLITDVLYWITTGLLVPVIVFLLFFLLRSLIMVGGFYGQYINRGKVNVRIRKMIDKQGVDQFLKEDFSKLGKANEFSEFIKRIPEHMQSAQELDLIAGDYEILADRELGKSKLLVKIGPMLGLMGTLIPMGPALVGLATGDIASMATNMQVAFATTVVGLIIAAVGFITLQVKQRWYAGDINLIEYIIETLKKEIK